MILQKGARDKQLSFQLYSEPGESEDGNTLLGGEGAMLAHDERKAETADRTRSYRLAWALGGEQ